MKHLKMLGLLVVAAASLMAFASSASASPVLTWPAGTEYTGVLEATGTSTLTLKASVFTETCTGSTVSGHVEVNQEGAGGGHAKGPITTLSFSGCGGEVPPVTLATGELTVNDSGEVFDIGSEVTVRKIGVTCVYGGGAGTKIGTLNPGQTATISISASLPKVAEKSGGLCAANAAWTGTYKVTSPDGLLIT